jgi:hypothetical protein
MDTKITSKRIFTTTLPSELIREIMEWFAGYTIVCMLSKSYNSDYKWRRDKQRVSSTVVLHGMNFRFGHLPGRGENKMLYFYTHFRSSEEVGALMKYYKKNNTLRPCRLPGIMYIRNIQMMNIGVRQTASSEAVVEFLDRRKLTSNPVLNFLMKKGV